MAILTRKLKNLPPATSLSDTDIVVGENEIETQKVTLHQIVNFICNHNIIRNAFAAKSLFDEHIANMIMHITDEERTKMTSLLNSGFTDSFRYLYPNKENCYTWWSYMFHAREKNAGWRIDYFIVSKSIESKIKDSIIYAEILGSDHCPVGLEIDNDFNSQI